MQNRPSFCVIHTGKGKIEQTMQKSTQVGILTMRSPYPILPCATHRGQGRPAGGERGGTGSGPGINRANKGRRPKGTPRTNKNKKEQVAPKRWYRADYAWRGRGCIHSPRKRLLPGVCTTLSLDHMKCSWGRSKRISTKKGQRIEEKNAVDRPTERLPVVRVEIQKTLNHFAIKKSGLDPSPTPHS
jgi:hypothetical protein